MKAGLDEVASWGVKPADIYRLPAAMTSFTFVGTASSLIFPWI